MKCSYCNKKINKDDSQILISINVLHTRCYIKYLEDKNKKMNDILKQCEEQTK